MQHNELHRKQEKRMHLYKNLGYSAKSSLKNFSNFSLHKKFKTRPLCVRKEGTIINQGILSILLL